MLVSFARADASSGLLADPRRLNVALSRARRMLILVGARSALASASPLFSRLVGAVPVVPTAASVGVSLFKRYLRVVGTYGAILRSRA